MIVVPLALALIFFMLYFTFNSVKNASLIFTAIPMSAIGGVFALLLRGMPFSISAGVGFYCAVWCGSIEWNCVSKHF